ncbi:MAG: chromosome segregation protein SMC, partial [bacterium]
QTLKIQLEMISQDHINLKQRHQDLEKQKSLLEKEKEQTSQELHQAHQDLKKLTEELTRWERVEASLSERLKEIDRRLVEELGVLPGVVSEMTLKEVKNRLLETPLGNLTTEELRSRLGNLGPINMMALEELKPVEERYRFLREQRKDLKEAITLLEETIDRTSRQARQRFLNTFEQVNRNFQELFQVLFEGGEARLVMEGDDPLTADIRIYATPSGKRLQSLASLSGGEKVLTAIAFLFALYKFRPAPFAILDEIDAPLDDINVTRFTRLLQQFSDRTQFLIVTHNKKTMEAADCLYGVSLSEDGSSQLVSVKLNHNPPRPVSERVYPDD